MVSNPSTKRVSRWLIIGCLLFSLTAATEAWVLYLLTKENRSLLRWVAVLIVTAEEERQAVEICREARKFCENTRRF